MKVASWADLMVDRTAENLVAQMAGHLAVHLAASTVGNLVAPKVAY